MALYATLLPELEQAIQQGSVVKCANMAERVTDLFIGGANHFSAEQVGLFDHILGRLSDEVGPTTLAGIARRIATVVGAPISLVRRLAGDDDIDVAGPVLRGSPCLLDADLAAVAARMGPPHLLAIAQRQALAIPVTDVLVERRDGGILQAVAANRGARFSDFGFGILVKWAVGDDELATTVGLRQDIPPAHLRQLLQDTTDVVRRRLSAAATMTARGETGGRIATPHSDAQYTVMALVRAGKLDVTQLRAFSENGQFAETAATLSALSHVPIAHIERLIRGERLDALLILGRAIGIDWATLHPIILLRPGRRNGPNFSEARANFERLSQPSAERVVGFWRDGTTKTSAST
jgi:uncharacterized protein (DUF2336 family)